MRVFTTLLVVVLWIILGNFLKNYEIFSLYQLISIMIWGVGVYYLIKEIEEGNER